MASSLIYRSEILRSLSDGIVLSEAKSPNENANVSKEEKIKPVFPDKMQDSNKGHSESAPDIFTCKIQASYFRLAHLTHRCYCIIL